MSWVHWQDELIEVRRVVLHRDTPAAFGGPLRTLAGRLGVPVAAPEVRPTSGDVWVGCSPEAGWGDADPRTVGWFSSLEVPLAVSVLGAAADGADEPAVVGPSGSGAGF